MRGGAVAGGLIAFPALLSACSKTDTSAGGGLLQKVKNQGYIQVGIAGEAPYGFMENGKLTGEGPAIQQEIFSNLGIKEVRATQVDFGQLIPGLVANRFDAVAAGMSITPARCGQAAFSEPEYVAPEAFLVPKGNPKNITDFDSVAKQNIKLGVLSGAVEGGYATAAGLASGNVIEVQAQKDGLSALQSGRIDALGLTSISLNYLVKTNPGANVEVTKPFTPVVKGKPIVNAGGAVFRKGDADLLQAYNEQLKKIQTSGRETELLQPFGFGPETLPPQGLTTAQLCQG